MFTLLEHPRFGAMLFDTGYSIRFFDETRNFPNRLYYMMTPVTLREDQLAVNQLSSLNIQPSDITQVFISHFHADHVAALGDFPRARYVYLPQAFDSVRNLRGFRALSHAYLPGLIPGDFSERATPVVIADPYALPPEYAPFTTGFDLLGDESLIAVELPGHATGQMGVFARNEDGLVYFFIADSAWLNRSFIENRPPYWLANFFIPNSQIYRNTLARIHQFHANRPDVCIIPSHCDETLAQHAQQLK